MPCRLERSTLQQVVVTLCSPCTCCCSLLAWKTVLPVGIPAQKCSLKTNKQTNKKRTPLIWVLPGSYNPLFPDLCVWKLDWSSKDTLFFLILFLHFDDSLVSFIWETLTQTRNTATDMLMYKLCLLILGLRMVWQTARLNLQWWITEFVGCFFFLTDDGLNQKAPGNLWSFGSDCFFFSPVDTWEIQTFQVNERVGGRWDQIFRNAVHRHSDGKICLFSGRWLLAIFCQDHLVTVCFLKTAGRGP